MDEAGTEADEDVQHERVDLATDLTRTGTGGMAGTNEDMPDKPGVRSTKQGCKDEIDTGKDSAPDLTGRGILLNFF